MNATVLCFISLALFPVPAPAYSQFTHEELIDLIWGDSIRPLLLQRYPNATEAELRGAHSFAYGGSLIQDVGYYPFGNRFFSNLAHYVRTGDFVAAMLREARNMNELAFAIGALSHYVGDSIGHSEAVNPSIAITFPKLEAKFGKNITFEEAPNGHVQTEFGFDVAQAARERFAPQAYKKRIGFRVARRLLYRAFRDTYGISARGILGPLRSALETYHWSVTSLLPAFLHAQIVLLRDDLPAETDDTAHTDLLLAVAKSDYAATSKHNRPRLGIAPHILAGIIFVIPKIGRLRALDTKAPRPSTEDLFIRSVDASVSSLRSLLLQLSKEPDPSLALRNLDLDTGAKVEPGRAASLDNTYAELLLRIYEERVRVAPDLRNALLGYYADPHRPGTGDDPGQRRMLQDALAWLGGRAQ